MTTIGHAWVTLIQSFATVALILTAFGLMLGLVKPADALKYVGAILGIVTVLMLIPNVLMNLWSAIPLWQWICVAAVGIGIWQWRRPRPPNRQRRKE
jgi:predicted tellurium resistance membrane protein TerC